VRRARFRYLEDGLDQKVGINSHTHTHTHTDRQTHTHTRTHACIHTHVHTHVCTPCSGRMALSGSSPDTAGADARDNRSCTLLTPYELRLLSNLRPPTEGLLHEGGYDSCTLQATGSASYLGAYLCVYSGGSNKHNFWTARVKSIKSYIFGILSSRSVD